MPLFERRSTVPVTPAELYAWHAREGALERLLPPWEKAELSSRSGTFADMCVVMRMNILGPIWQRWVAQHGDVIEGVRFRDTQIEGPFARWVHTHSFEPAPGGSVLVDQVDYTLPLGPLGALFGTGFASRRIARMFEFRHQRTHDDLSRHGYSVDAAAPAPLRVAVTGASGLIGTQLCAFLTTGGHRVDRLVRRAPGAGEIRWDPQAGTVDVAALEGVDAVIHLAGENVAGGRWTPERKERIYRSRVDGTRAVAEALARLDKKPRVFLSASAVGYYGDTGDTAADESAPAGTGFLAEVCKAWEEAAEPARKAGIRVIHPRIGVVLSGAGGALAEMKRPFSLGVGGPIGGGQQWLPWIAMDDTVGALHHLLRADVEGPVNLVAPTPVRQADFARALGRVLRRPSALPLPAFAVKAIFGEMGQGVLLAGQRVVPKRLAETGFTFLHEDLEETLRFELGK